MSVYIIVLYGALLFVLPAVAAAPRPNIILILTDDQSPIAERSADPIEPHTFGVYGGQVHTPNIDRMAAEGIRFDRANVAITVCTASRYTFLTGRYATRSRGHSFTELFPPGSMSRPGNQVELDPPGTLINLPQTLQANGYRTGFVGKSHMIRHELLRNPGETWEPAGLKTYPRDGDPHDPAIARALAHNHASWASWLKPYGFDYVDGVYSGNLKAQFLDANHQHHVEWTMSKALEFLEGSRDSEQPFFLYVATTVPHGPHPYQIGGTRYPFELGGAVYPFGLDGDIRVTPEGIASDDDFGFMPSRDEIRKQNAAAGYPEKVAYMTWLDAGVGAILAKLQAIGADENTLVVLTSDHGAWRRGKATLYDGGMRVPMITRWPASKQADRVYDGLVSSVDFAPTVLDLAGISPEAGSVDGRSFRAVLEGSDAPVRDKVFAELGWSRAVKTERWKYIAVRYPEPVQRRIERGGKFQAGNNQPPIDRPYLSKNGNLGAHAAQYNPHYFSADQLFDLRADPTEEHNVIGEHPGVDTEMRALLGEWLRGFPDRPFGEFTQAREPEEADATGAP